MFSRGGFPGGLHHSVHTCVGTGKHCDQLKLMQIGILEVAVDLMVIHRVFYAKEG